MSPSSIESVFLLKLTPDGNFMWARSWGSSEYDFPGGLANDESGVYINMRIYGEIDLDPGPDSDTRYGSLAVCKLDPDGSYLWGQVLGNNVSSFPQAATMCVDGSGDLYSAGIFFQSTDFDPGTSVDERTSNGEADVFIWRLDSDGNYVWTRTWGGVGHDGINGLTMDDSGIIYATGRFNSLTDFDPGPGVTSQDTNGLVDIFVSKLDSDGNLLWVRTLGSETWDIGHDIAIDANGRVCLTGEFTGMVDFDPGTPFDYHTSNGIENAFYYVLDPDGNW
jgi:hypothetical protein